MEKKNLSENKKKLVISVKLILRLFQYSEVLILFGIQLFLVGYYMEYTDPHTYLSYAYLIAPVIVILLTGILLKNQDYRKLLKKMEPIFHFAISILLICMLSFIQFSNDLYSWIPFGLMFSLWTVYVGLILSTIQVSELNERSFGSYFKEKKELQFLLIMGTLVWGITVLISLFMEQVTVFWIFSSILHLIMAPISFLKNKNQKQTDTPENPEHLNLSKDQIIGKHLTDLSGISRYLLLIMLQFVSWIQWGTYYLERFESPSHQYESLISMFASPWFYLGVLAALFLFKTRLHKIGDSICVVLGFLIFFDFNALSPFITGYTTLYLILIASSLGSISSIRTSIAFFLQFLFWGVGIALAFFTFEITMFVGSIVKDFVLYAIVLFVILSNLSESLSLRISSDLTKEVEK